MYLNYLCYVIVEHLRLGGPSGNRPVKAGKAKVFVTDGKSVPLHGWCLVFTRTSVKTALTEANMPQVGSQWKTLMSLYEIIINVSGRKHIQKNTKWFLIMIVALK